MHPAFEVHMLNEDGKLLARQLADAYEQLRATVELACASGKTAGGRELALATTKLEESCFYAKKAMAMQPWNHTPPEAP